MTSLGPQRSAGISPDCWDRRPVSGGEGIRILGGPLGPQRFSRPHQSARNPAPELKSASRGNARGMNLGRCVCATHLERTQQCCSHGRGALCSPRGSLLVLVEAVAQTPGKAAGPLLRVGSEIGQLVRRKRVVCRNVVPHSCSGVHFRERAARFLRRLCATASAIRSSRCIARKRRDQSAASPMGAALSAVGGNRVPARYRCPRLYLG